MNVFSASSKTALTLFVAACVVACILSCRLRAPLEKSAAVEEGYLIGETDPLSRAVSMEPIVDFIACDVTLASADNLTDKPDTVFTREDAAGVAEVMTDLNGKLDEYMFIVDFGDAGGVIEIEDLSSKDPAVPEEVLEVNDGESPLMDPESNPFLLAEDNGEEGT